LIVTYASSFPSNELILAPKLSTYDAVAGTCTERCAPPLEARSRRWRVPACGPLVVMIWTLVPPKNVHGPDQPVPPVVLPDSNPSNATWAGGGPAVAVGTGVAVRVNVTVEVGALVPGGVAVGGVPVTVGVGVPGPVPPRAAYRLIRPYPNSGSGPGAPRSSAVDCRALRT